MKIWLKIVLIFVWTLCLCNFGYAQQASLKLPELIANVGDTVSLPIKVSTDSLIGIAQFVIEYDSAVIKFISGATGNATKGFFSLFNPLLPFPTTNEGVNANVLGQVSSGSKSFSGKEREVILFHFKVIGQPGEMSPILFDRYPDHTSLATSPLLNEISGAEIQFDDGSISISSTPLPDITVSPDFHDFGYVTVGSISKKRFIIKNVGSVDLEITNIDLIGTNESEFLLEMGSLPITLSPGNTIEVMINFKPTSTGTKSASIQIVSNDPDESPLEIPLQGNSVDYSVPDIDVDPLAHHFGDVALGSTSEKIITIKNEGTAVLKVSDILLFGTDANQFSMAGQETSFNLNPTESRAFTVYFKPTAIGLKQATLRIVNNDPDENLVEISLAGNGIDSGEPDIVVDTLSYDFGEVVLDSSASKSFLLQNLGTADLKINSIILIGTNSDQFSIETDVTNFILNICELRSIDVRFQPGSIGVKYATLRINSNDPDESSLEIALQGKGIEFGIPDIYFEPLSHNFGDVALGSSSKKIFLMKNQGMADLKITAITLIGSNSTEFSIESGAAPLTLSPGEEKDVLLRFHPNSVGQKMDTLRIISNDSDESPLDISITGNGIESGLPKIFVDPSNYDYGDVKLGSSASKIFIITNQGTADLLVTSTQLIGMNKNDFSIEKGGAPFQLGAKENQDLSVTFHPAAVGEKSAILRIMSNDPEKSQYDISLFGTGEGFLSDTTGTYAFPNPFKPESEPIQIFFNVKPFQNGTIKILDSHGELVQKIEIPTMFSSDNQYIISWDGRNTLGDYVVNGVYFYLVETNNDSRLMSKIAVLR